MTKQSFSKIFPVACGDREDFCSFGAFCLACGKAKSAKTAKNLPGRRRRPGSQETFEKPCSRNRLEGKLIL